MTASINHERMPVLLTHPADFETWLSGSTEEFSINGDDARPVFAFPGVDTLQGPLKKNGDSVEQEVFAFMTTEPNELTASINHERMPVSLHRQLQTWLSGSADEAFKLARSYAAEQMRIVQSGSERKDMREAA